MYPVELEQLIRQGKAQDVEFESSVPAPQVVAKHIADVFGGRRKDKRQKSAFGEFRETLDERMNGFDRRIDKLFAFVIGPDGENGIRGKQRELERRFDEMEERERARDRELRLPQGGVMPSYDRRSGT